MLYSQFGIDLPALFREDFSYYVKDISDKAHKELSPQDICDIFQNDFVNLKSPLSLKDYHFTRTDEVLSVNLKVEFEGKSYEISGSGNGRLDAVANALRENLSLDFDIMDYSEHALKEGSSSQAISYVQIQNAKGKYFGVGIDTDIIAASIYGLISAINRASR